MYFNRRTRRIGGRLSVSRLKYSAYEISQASSSSSSFDCAGQRLTPHSRTLEVRPGRINKKLELHYDYDVKGMILNYYSVSQMHDLVVLDDTF